MRKVVINGIDTKSLPKITQSECEELLQKTKEGDKEAQDKLVIANLRLVLSMVQRFSGRANGDDLFQVGVVGLMKAIDGFDPKFNVRFSTYAVPMISGEMRRFIKDGTGIKVSRSMRDTAYKALKAKEEYELKHSTSPTMLEIAAEIDVPLRDVVCALDAVSETVSLQECVYSDGEDGLLLMEQIGDSKQNEENWSTNLALRDAIAQLPDREKEVLKLRYYVGKTQMEISRKIGISQAQVSRLEKNAFGKIKECL